MSSFLAKRILLTAPYFSYSHYHFHHHRLQLALLMPLLCRSLSTQPPQQPKEEELRFFAHYLISSFGFSTDRALKYSSYKQLTAIKSFERPDSVVRFLKDTGLSDDQIKAAASYYPVLLASNVEKTLKPKVRVLMDAGFSGELLAQLIRYNSTALARKDTLSRLLFGRDFVGNNDEVVLKMIRVNSFLISYDIGKNVVPIINLLKEYGLSSQDIVSLMGIGSARCCFGRLDSLRQALEPIE